MKTTKIYLTEGDLEVFKQVLDNAKASNENGRYTYINLDFEAIVNDIEEALEE